MKKLMFVTLISSEGKMTPAEIVYDISVKARFPEEPRDWRDMVRDTAEILQWPLRGSDLEDVCSFAQFMIRVNPSFKNLRVRQDVHLPGGAVILDQYGENEAPWPLGIIWEEDW